MNRKELLSDVGLTPENSIVIGSGILDVLGLRPSKDINVVVPKETYSELLSGGQFHEKIAHERKSLIKGELAVIDLWRITQEAWAFQDLIDHSIIIDGVRYITIEFLFSAKSRWLLNGEFLQKDKEDIILMNSYFDRKVLVKCCCS